MNYPRAILTPGKGQVAILYSRVARPGDVLLTRGRALSSALTAFVTRNRPFSHASMFVPPVLYESLVERGVGPTLLVPTRRSTPLPGPPVDLDRRLGLLRLPDAKHYLVLRHPGVAGRFGELEFADLVANVAVLSEYPNMSDLAGTLPVSAAVSGLLQDVVARLEHAMRARKRMPGMFCSQLVVSMFEAAGLTVFSGKRPAHTVSPNDLLDSNLQPVPNAIDALPPSALSEAPEDENFGRLRARMSFEATRKVMRLQIRILEANQRYDREKNSSPRTPAGLVRKYERMLAATQDVLAASRELVEFHEQGERERRQLLASVEGDELGQLIQRASNEKWALRARLARAGHHFVPVLIGGRPAELASGIWVRTQAQAGSRWQVQLDDGTVAEAERDDVHIDQPIE